MAADRLRFLDATRLRQLMPVAVSAIERAVSRYGSSAFPRTVVDTQGGQVLLMPAESGAHAGVKIATVAPGTPQPYLLMDAATLTPVLLVDAAELTAIRTAAVSATAISHLADQGAGHLVVFGTGSHEPTTREVDTALVCSAAVVVETRESALREAGDLAELRRRAAARRAGPAAVQERRRGLAGPCHRPPRRTSSGLSVGRRHIVA